MKKTIPITNDLIERLARLLSNFKRPSSINTINFFDWLRQYLIACGKRFLEGLSEIVDQTTLKKDPGLTDSNVRNYSVSGGINGKFSNVSAKCVDINLKASDIYHDS